MDFNRACKLFNFDCLEFSTSDMTYSVKSRYRQLAHLYHPDRNKNADAAEKFFEIRAAYELILEYCCEISEFPNGSSAYNGDKEELIDHFRLVLIAICGYDLKTNELVEFDEELFDRAPSYMRTK